MNKKIQQIRKKIDKNDTEILKLIKKRSMLVKNIGKIKKKNGFNVVDKKREKEIFSRVKREGKNLGLNEKLINSLFRSIIKESRRTQK